MTKKALGGVTDSFANNLGGGVNCALGETSAEGSRREIIGLGDAPVVDRVGHVVVHGGLRELLAVLEAQLLPHLQRGGGIKRGEEGVQEGVS